MVIVQDIFPELAESEDERIRKEIINYLDFAESHNLLRATDYEKKKEWIAYLEKQKYDRMKPVYDARESFESALAKAWNDYHNGYEKVDKLEDDYVECAHAKGFREGYLFGIEKQKEQKPEDRFEEARKKYQVEWSKEDLGWISVKDRLPEKDGWYFTCIEQLGVPQCVGLSHFETYSGQWDDDDDSIELVDYWMPIPKLPNKEEK